MIKNWFKMIILINILIWNKMKKLLCTNNYNVKINKKKYYYQINACIKFNIKKIICNNTLKKML